MAHDFPCGRTSSLSLAPRSLRAAWASSCTLTFCWKSLAPSSRLQPPTAASSTAALTISSRCPGGITFDAMAVPLCLVLKVADHVAVGDGTEEVVRLERSG